MFISVENIKKSYQIGEVEIPALSGATFSVEKGEFAVIVGPSGAGKSTVLNILGGMDRCDEGQLIVDGEQIHACSEKELIRYLFFNSIIWYKT